MAQRAARFACRSEAAAGSKGYNRPFGGKYFRWRIDWKSGGANARGSRKPVPADRTRDDEFSRDEGDAGSGGISSHAGDPGAAKQPSDARYLGNAEQPSDAG